MDIVAGYGLRERVLGTKRGSASGDAAAIGKRSDRLGEVFGEGIADKNLVAIGEAVVDTEVELILIVGFIAETAEIVGETGRGGGWVAV